MTKPLRIPNQILKVIARDYGTAALVAITQHMVGEMKNPASILVDSQKLEPASIDQLHQLGAKIVIPGRTNQ